MKQCKGLNGSLKPGHKNTTNRTTCIFLYFCHIHTSQFIILDKTPASVAQLDAHQTGD